MSFLEDEGLKLVWERGADGKLTQEAKFQVEKLSAEQVRRDVKRTGAERRREEDAHVPLESEIVLRKKPKGKLSWLQKAFRGLAEERITGPNVTRVYEILASPTFCDDWHHAQSKKAFELITSPANLNFFTANQQKFLCSDRFKIYRAHAVINLISSDEEAGQNTVLKRAKTEQQWAREGKPKWLIRKERRQQGLRSDSDAESSSSSDERNRPSPPPREKKAVGLGGVGARGRRSSSRGRSRDGRREPNRDRGGRDAKAADATSKKVADTKPSYNEEKLKEWRRQQYLKKAADAAGKKDAPPDKRNRDRDSRRRDAKAVSKRRRSDSRKKDHGGKISTREDRDSKRRGGRKDHKKNNAKSKKSKKSSGRRKQDSSSDSSSSSSSSESESEKSEKSEDDKSDDEKSEELNAAAKSRKGKVERRIDPHDDQMYSLDEFCEAYGGTAQNPPKLWVQQRHTAFFFAH